MTILRYDAEIAAWLTKRRVATIEDDGILRRKVDIKYAGRLCQVCDGHKARCVGLDRGLVKCADRLGNSRLIITNDIILAEACYLLAVEVYADLVGGTAGQGVLRGGGVRKGGSEIGEGQSLRCCQDGERNQ